MADMTISFEAVGAILTAVVGTTVYTLNQINSIANRLTAVETVLSLIRESVLSRVKVEEDHNPRR